VILPALNNTLMLGATASILAILIGLAMGNAATSRWRALRRAIDWVEALFLSAPQYTVALILLICFAVLLPLFPAGGFPTRATGAPRMLRDICSSSGRACLGSRCTNGARSEDIVC